MLKRVLPLAVTAPFVLPGCWAWGPADTNQTKPASLISAQGQSGEIQRIDLTGGKAVRPGYGRFTVEVGMASQLASRRVAAVGPDQKLLIFVTKADGSEVDDENGKDAIYTATVAGATASVALPGLPMTTSVLGGTSGNPYTINALIGNWDNTSVPSSAAATYATFKSGGTALLQYGSAPSAGEFGLTNLAKDVKLSYQWVGATEATLFPNGRLLRTGYGRTEVTPGIIPTVTLDHYDHMLADFANNADATATTTKARANVVSLGSLAPSGGTLRLRHPGLALDTIDQAGGIRKVRYIIGMQDDAAGIDINNLPHLNIKTYDAESGQTISGVNIDADFAKYTLPSDTSNTAYALGNELAYVDVNMGPINTGSTSAKNVVDFTLTNVPGTSAVKLYMVPLGANSVMSGPFSSNIF